MTLEHMEGWSETVFLNTSQLVGLNLEKPQRSNLEYTFTRTIACVLSQIKVLISARPVF